MKNLFYTLAALWLWTGSQAQNIGISADNPSRAKLEVWGVSGLGKTSGFFGGERGISLHRNYAGIGMNQYFDNSPYGRYMASGYAAVWQMIHDDATLASGFSLTIYPSGAANAVMPAGIRAWHFTRNNRFQIQSTGGGGSGELDVGRGTSWDGTAVFQGTNNWSHFNNGSNEDTYIRGGKGSSHVIINDIAGGKVIIGNGATTVGINTNYYVPPTTLEVRQSNGGMELTNTFRTDLPWEWRVPTGSNAHFQLLYANSVRTYFNYINGSLNPISDARLKTNITPLPGVLDKIMLLNPVSYKMKDAVTGQGRSMGFLAQNVQPLFPQLISPGMNNSDLLGLNYGGFGVIAIKGVQEEQVQIDELDKDFSAMETRLQAIEQKLGKSKQ